MRETSQTRETCEHGHTSENSETSKCQVSTKTQQSPFLFAPQEELFVPNRMPQSKAKLEFLLFRLCCSGFKSSALR